MGEMIQIREHLGNGVGIYCSGNFLQSMRDMESELTISCTMQGSQWQERMFPRGHPVEIPRLPKLMLGKRISLSKLTWASIAKGDIHIALSMWRG